MFLTKQKITVLEHPPYSPDKVPCNFFISKGQVFIKRKQVGRHGSSEGKSDGAHEYAIRWPAVLLPTLEYSHGAV
jgi:hypothetical protein